MKIRKYLLLALGGATLAMSLASCGGATKEIEIVNPDGSKEKLELTATDNEEVVRKALTYVGQADYDVMGIGVKINYSNDIYLDENNNDKTTLNTEIALKQEGDDNNPLIFMSGKVSSFSNSKSESSVGAGDATTQNISVNANIYSELSEQSPYIYLDQESSYNGEKDSGKTKMLVSDLLGSTILPQPASSNVKLVAAAPELPQFGSNLYDIILQQLFAKKIEISNVKKNSFVISISLSLNDLLTKNGGFGLIEDLIFAVDFEFNTKTGRLLNAGVYINDTILLIVAYGGDVNNNTVVINDDSYAKLSCKLEVSYEKTSVKKLSDKEKAEYIEA